MLADKRREHLETLVDRIKTTDDLSEDDRDILIQFHRELELLGNQYSVHRHEKLLRHCTLMVESVGGLNRALEEREAAEDIVRWINREHQNEETNKDYRIALRVFGKRVSKDNGDDIPDSIDWVPSSTSRNYDPKPDPSEMLKWEEDVLPMIEATQNSRDAALIATAWDSGARSGEIRTLEVGNVSDHRHGLQITVDGKTGQRSIILIPAVPYLQRWLMDHPDPDTPSAPLWSKLSKPETMVYQSFRKILNTAADRAGVEKPVTLTNFRKSSASHLASRNINQAHLEDHHGWTRGSKVASRYVSIFSGVTEREIARAHGAEIEEEDESEPIAPVECPRCARETPRNKEFCVWCHQAISVDALEKLRVQERDVRDAILKLVKEEPSLLDDIDRYQTVMNILEDDPALYEDAEAFIQALSDA